MLLQFIIKAASAEEIYKQARRAMEAGVTWIEICAPESVRDDELKTVVERLRPELAEKTVVLIIGGNRYEKAKEWETDGVHVYAMARPVSAVRVAIDAWPIIGVSVASLPEVESTCRYDIDYLYFESDGTPEALETIREIAHFLDKNAIEKPLVAGGGITPANILEVVDAGAASVASSNIDAVEELLHIARNITQKNV